MVLTLVMWAYIHCFNCSLGLMLYNLLSNIFGWKFTKVPAYLLSLFGLCFLTGYLAIYSLFAPINVITHLTLIIPLAFYAVKRKAVFKLFLQPRLSFSKTEFLFLLLPVLIIVLNLLYLNTLPVLHTDSGLYHIQAIKWPQYYPVVPGIGNLLSQIGYNSSFFLWSAFFSGVSLTSQPIYALNSYLVLLLTVTGLTLFRAAFTKDKSKMAYSIFPVILCGLIPIIFDRAIASPTPDIALTVILAFIFTIQIYQLGKSGKEINAFETLTLVLLVLTAFTIKISVAPIAGVLLYLIFTEQVKLSKQWVMLVAASGLFIFGPWFIRNIIQTGYLVYPFPYLDIFTVDWKVPMPIVLDEMNMIKSFAKEGANDWQRVLQTSFWVWVKSWYSYQSTYYKFILAGAALSPLFMVILGYLKREAPGFTNLYKKLLALWFIYYAGFLFWLYFVPSIRFGVTFIYLSLLIPIIFVLQGTISKYSAFVYVLGITIILGLGLNQLRDLVHFLRFQPAVIQARLMYQEYHPVPALAPVKVSHVNVWRPVKELVCWDAPIPCTYHLVKGLELRGKDLASGFRIKSKE
ncbi:LIC_10190 family membrane protein [Adhaeribacter rhizoryzae]|nr:hypothetical protein [Adhaeribacter rhizoryzae]